MNDLYKLIEKHAYSGKVDPNQGITWVQLLKAMKKVYLIDYDKRNMNSNEIKQAMTELRGAKEHGYTHVSIGKGIESNIDEELSTLNQL
jgi:predicted Ser/Thr protein kinase